MTNDKEFDSVINKVKEMQDFFKFGGEIIPFLVELFKFLRGIMPLIVEANTSLQESTHKLPTASDKISLASEKTELATQQIMDKLDNISEKLTFISSAEETSAAVKDQVEDIQNDIFDILNALQFQDITAQQLEHANRILQAIYDQFNNLFISVRTMDVSSKFQESLFSEFVEKSKTREILQKSREFIELTEDKVHTNENFSQDDIDSLFD